MASMTLKNGVLVGVIGVLALYIVYQYDRSMFGLLGSREGFYAEAAAGASKPAADAKPAAAPAAKPAAAPAAAAPKPTPPAPAPSEPSGTKVAPGKEGFADLASMEGPAAFASAEAPAGCYPRAQLTPVELLPADQTSIYAQQNPMGTAP